jgi:hypothetical protein
MAGKTPFPITRSYIGDAKVSWRFITRLPAFLWTAKEPLWPYGM